MLVGRASFKAETITRLPPRLSQQTTPPTASCPARRSGYRARHRQPVQLSLNLAFQQEDLHRVDFVSCLPLFWPLQQHEQALRFSDQLQIIFLHPLAILSTFCSMPGSPPKSGPYPPQRNPSTCSTASNDTTASSSSSLEAAPMIPPPIETRTAATSEAQLPSPEDLQRQEDEIRTHGQTTTTGRRRGSAGKTSSASPTTPRARRFPLPAASQPPAYLLPEEVQPHRQTQSMDWNGSEGGRTPLRINVHPSTVQRADGPRSAGSDSPHFGRDHLSSSPVHRSRARSSEDRILRSPSSEVPITRERDQSGPRKPSINDFVIGQVLGRGSYSTVSGD